MVHPVRSAQLDLLETSEIRGKSERKAPRDPADPQVRSELPDRPDRLAIRDRWDLQGLSATRGSKATRDRWVIRELRDNLAWQEQWEIPVEPDRRVRLVQPVSQVSQEIKVNPDSREQMEIPEQMVLQGQLVLLAPSDHPGHRALLDSQGRREQLDYKELLATQEIKDLSDLLDPRYTNLLCLSD